MFWDTQHPWGCPGCPGFHFERSCRELAARHHFSSTESPVRAPFPEATAAPRPIQARVSLPNPSHGQPPATSNCPCIRRGQRGSPVQLAHGVVAATPPAPIQPQDPAARAPALGRHEARVRTCVRPCARTRVDLWCPSTSAAHVPPALCAQLQTCHQDKRHEPETPNGPRAGARHVSALHDTCPRPPKRLSHHQHHTTCAPAHISPRRAARPVGNLLDPALATAHHRRVHRSSTCPPS